MSSDEVRRKAEKPLLDVPGAFAAASRLYDGVVAFDAASSAKEIDSYDDRNFLLRGCLADGSDDVKKTEACDTFILKVHNGVESTNIDFVRAQVKVLMHLAAAGYRCPQSLPFASSEDVADPADARISYLELPLKDGSGQRRHAVRLLPYIEGSLLSDVEQTRERLEHVGDFLARIDKCLMSFEHPACIRTHMWDLKNFPGMRNFTKYIADEADKKRVEFVLEDFDRCVSMHESSLRKSVIQCDANDHNVIVDVEGRSDVVALIDFGDMVHSWLVNEIAIGMAYIVVGCIEKDDDPVGKALELFAGYDRALPRLTPKLPCCVLL